MAAGSPVDDADRWAAFNLSAGRAAVPRLRGQLREAAQYSHEAINLLGAVQPEELDYPRAFRLLTVLRNLIGDLARADGTREALTHYSDAAAGLARRLRDLHKEEPDYARALAHQLMQRAQLFPGTPGAVQDVQDAVAAIGGLERQEPLPWRAEEALRFRTDAQRLLTEWGLPPA